MKHEFFLELISKSGRNDFFLAVSLLFILGGVVNIGITGFLFAIPFLFTFFMLVKHYSRQSKYSLIILVVTVCVFFIWNKPKNTLIFPYLGSKAEVVSGWAYVKTYDSNNLHLIPPENIETWKKNLDSKYLLELVILDKNIELTMDRVELTYPEFVLSLTIIFTDSNGVNYSIFPEELIKGVAINDIKSKQLKGVESYQSTWTEYLGNLMLWPMLPIIIFN